MLDKENRRLVAKRLGEAVDSLVVDLYSAKIDGHSTIQEPEISSRLCQRLEDKLDNTQAGVYVFRVIAQSLPDRGPNSLERLIGADIFLSVSLDGPGGFDKGILIQAKYDRNIDPDELRDSCSRMRQEAQNNGAYVWVYEPDGVKVISSHQVDRLQSPNLDDVIPRSARGFFGRILDCYAGSKALGIPSTGDRRGAVQKKLRDMRARNIVDINIKKAKSGATRR